MTLPISCAMSLVCSDAWSSQTEASIIRKVFTMPVPEMPALEACCREQDTLTEVSDDVYQETRLSVIG